MWGTVSAQIITKITQRKSLEISVVPLATKKIPKTNIPKIAYKPGITAVKKTANGLPFGTFCKALGNLGTNRAVCLIACQNPK
jgi:hypothetical protein